MPMFEVEVEARVIFDDQVEAKTHREALRQVLDNLRLEVFVLEVRRTSVKEVEDE